MPIPEDKIAGILAEMKSSDLTLRMRAFAAGKELFNNWFIDCETIEQYAEKANALEMGYNLLRVGLRKEAVKITDVQKAEKAAQKAAQAKEKPNGTKREKSTRSKMGGVSPAEFLASRGISLTDLVKAKLTDQKQ